MEHTWTILIASHAIAATYAVIFGAYNLLRKKKGDRLHKILGFVWLAAMYFVICSSFFIRMIRPGGYSWIHGLSVFTFCTISLGLYAAARHRIDAHKAYMAGSYFGLLGALVGVIAVPSRLVPQLVVGDFVRFVLIVSSVAASAALFIVATRRLVRAAETETPDTQ